MLTILEDLPNELLIEIFDYTPIKDLSFGFWNLNKRFNKLIQSLKYLSLILTKNETYESILFSKQIIRLVIVTLVDINLKQFINLRTLIINWGNENHLKQIQSQNFPNLIYLSLSISFDFQSTRQLTSDIFSNQFRHLHYADLGKIDIPIDSSWSQSLSIRSLLIVSNNINIIPLILNSCPKLIHFQIRIIHNENDFSYSVSLPNIINHPLKKFIFIQSQTSTFIFNIIEILYLIPNIKQLDLQLCTRSFSHLIEFISKYFIYLNHFNCHIIEYPNTDNNYDINRIRNIHRCYSCIQRILREDSFCLYTTKQMKISK